MTLYAKHTRDELIEEIEEYRELCDQLSSILTRTANALKGEPKPHHRHSWHDLPEVAEHVRLDAEVTRHERDSALAKADGAIRLLTGIHFLLYPPRFTDNDNITWTFRSPNAHDQLQELSDRIRALPDAMQNLTDHSPQAPW